MQERKNNENSPPPKPPKTSTQYATVCWGRGGTETPREGTEFDPSGDPRSGLGTRGSRLAARGGSLLRGREKSGTRNLNWSLDWSLETQKTFSRHSHRQRFNLRYVHTLTYVRRCQRRYCENISASGFHVGRGLYLIDQDSASSEMRCGERERI